MDNPALLRCVAVRLARQEDLASMEWEGALIHFRNLFSDAYEQTRSGGSEIWLAEMKNAWLAPRILIGQLILSLRFSTDDHLENAYLYGFRVKDQYRSQGVGSLLLQKVENSLRKRGCHSLVLNVARDNDAARRLYERCSFRITGEEEGHWFYTDHTGVRQEVHEPAWRMEKALF